MTTLGDEAGTGLHRALGTIGREVMRSLINDRAHSIDIKKQLMELQRITGEKWDSTAFRTDGAAAFAAKQLQEHGYDCKAVGSFVIHREADAIAAEAVLRGLGIPFFAYMEESAKKLPEPIQGAIDAKRAETGLEYGCVRFPADGNHQESDNLCKAIVAILQERGVAAEAVDDYLIFPKESMVARPVKEEILSIIEEVTGQSAKLISRDAKASREMGFTALNRKLAPATEKQLYRIHDLAERRVVSADELRAFETDPTIAAARELLNRHKEQAGELNPIDYGSKKSPFADLDHYYARPSVDSQTRKPSHEPQKGSSQKDRTKTSDRSKGESKNKQIKRKETDGPRQATDRQMALIEKLGAEGIVSESELVAFQLDYSFAAARDLLNRHSDVAGKLDPEPYAVDAESPFDPVEEVNSRAAEVPEAAEQRDLEDLRCEKTETAEHLAKQSERTAQDKTKRPGKEETL